MANQFVRKLPLIAISMLALASGYWLSMRLNDKPTVPDLTAVTVLSSARALPELALVDQDGQAFDLADSNQALDA